MARKKDDFYFNNFITCSEFAKKEADLLREILGSYEPCQAASYLEKLHHIEHEADLKKHELTDELTHAFITPIEREDIALLSNLLDDLVDKLEEVFLRIYINNVPAIRPQALPMLDIVINCCEKIEVLMHEFADFKHAKTIQTTIISINTLEEEADRLYIHNMRDLHNEQEDLLSIIAWREIYSYLEKCADACEHIADVVGEIIMKNS